MSKLHYQILGAGEPLVMLHGWAMHSGIWQEFAQQLAQHYQVICIDLPGHGFSEPLCAYSLATINDAVLEVIPVREFKILGWSLGAILAIDIAARAKDRVNGVVLVAGNPCFIASRTWPGVESALLDAVAEQLALDVRQTLSRFLALQVAGLDNAKRQLLHMRQLLESRPVADALALQAGLKILKCSDMREQFQHLSSPLAIILGGKDALVPFEVAENLKELNPAADIQVLAEAGHLPFMSHPEQMLEHIVGAMS